METKYKSYILGVVLCFFSLNSVEAENLEIEASSFLEWNQEDKSYKASGNATASQGSRSINADEITAYYESEENRNITRIEATGEVNFTDNTHSGHSETLMYEMESQNVLLSGRNSHFKSDKFTAEASTLIQFNEATGELLLQKDAAISISGSRKIEAEQIEILLTDSGEIRTMEASNSVKFTEESGRVASAAQAFYEDESGDMILVESVEIIDGNNFLQGDKAIINVKTGYSKIFAGDKSNRVLGKLILGASK